MILRLSRATVPAAERDTLLRHAREVALPSLRGRPGLRDAYAALAPEDSSVTLIAVTVWRGIEQLVESVGLDVDRDPLCPPFALRATVEHYELVDAPEDQSPAEPAAAMHLAPGAVGARRAPILRLMTGRLRPNAEEEFHNLGRARQAELASTSGFVASHIGRRVEEGRTSVVALTAWRDWDAVRAYAGSGLALGFLHGLDALVENPRLQTLDAITGDSAAGRLSLEDAIVLIADDERRYVDAAGDLRDVLGADRTAVVGRRVDEISAGAYRTAAASAWQEFLVTGGMEGDYELERPDGLVVPVHFRARTHVPRRGVHASLLNRRDRPLDPLLLALPFEDLVLRALDSE